MSRRAECIRWCDGASIQGCKLQTANKLKRAVKKIVSPSYITLRRAISISRNPLRPVPISALFLWYTRRADQASLFSHLSFFLPLYFYSSLSHIIPCQTTTTSKRPIMKNQILMLPYSRRRSYPRKIKKSKKGRFGKEGRVPTCGSLRLGGMTFHFNVCRKITLHVLFPMSALYFMNYLDR